MVPMSRTSAASGGLVFAWGFNEDDECGMGENGPDCQSIPTPIKFPPSVLLSSVSCGSRHTLALAQDGTVWSWGNGMCGQLGIGTVKNSSTPVCARNFDGNRIVGVSAGGMHSAALTESGSVYTWGESRHGQLGLGPEVTQECVSVPCKVVMPEGTPAITQVACGGQHTGAVTVDGGLLSWGRGDSGALGVGNRWVDAGDLQVGFSTPQVVVLGEGVVVAQLACGAFHSAAVTTDGRLLTWGKEDYGMLGRVEAKDQQVPSEVSGLRANGEIAVQVCCGGWHTMVVTESGKLFAFGRGEYGRMGLGDDCSRRVPEQVASVPPVASVAAGGTHSLILTKDGRVFTCGRGDHGRLGTGMIDTKGHTLPELVKALTVEEVVGSVTAVAAGGAHCMALATPPGRAGSPSSSGAGAASSAPAPPAPAATSPRRLWGLGLGGGKKK